MEQIGWLIDLRRCISCRACEGGCKQEFRCPVGVRRRRVIIKEGGTYPRAWRHGITLACNHCEHPACLAACPVNAYTKRASDGIVVHDQGKCIGCKRCTWSCPYGAPQFDDGKKKVDKCSFCRHRQDAGKPTSCALTCMAEVIRVDKLSVIDSGRYGAVVRTVPGFPDPTMTNPSIRFISDGKG